MAVPAEFVIPAVLVVICLMLYLFLKALESWYYSLTKKEDRGKNAGLGFLYLFCLVAIFGIVVAVGIWNEKKSSVTF